MRRLLERHPDGMEEWFHWNDSDRTFSIQRVADVEPQVDWAKAMDRSDSRGWSRTREWKLVASVPVAVQLQMIEHYGADPFKRGNEDLMKRVLNDPDYRYLRIGGMI